MSPIPLGFFEFEGGLIDYTTLQLRRRRRGIDSRDCSKTSLIIKYQRGVGVY